MSLLPKPPKPLKPPRDLDHYLSADDAASALEDLAREIRCGDDKVKWSISISFYPPRRTEDGIEIISVGYKSSQHRVI